MCYRIILGFLKMRERVGRSIDMLEYLYFCGNILPVNQKKN